MPNLMDLPAELHIEIAKNVLFKSDDYYVHPDHADQILQDFAIVRAFRSLSPYWASIVDQLMNKEIARLERKKEDDFLYEMRLTRCSRIALLVKS